VGDEDGFRGVDGEPRRGREIWGAAWMLAGGGSGGARMIEKLQMEIEIFRQEGKPGSVLICFRADGQAEQKHLLQSTTGVVSTASVVEAVEKIISQIVEGSVFNDGSPPGTVAALQGAAC
jgi:hypothetical protein